jgi:hypothetical protein
MFSKNFELFFWQAKVAGGQSVEAIVKRRIESDLFFILFFIVNDVKVEPIALRCKPCFVCFHDVKPRCDALKTLYGQAFAEISGLIANMIFYK